MRSRDPSVTSNRRFVNEDSMWLPLAADNCVILITLVGFHLFQFVVHG
jgi:hypothetical protein